MSLLPEFPTSLIPLLFLAGLASGCTAVRAGAQVQEAISARDAALARDADVNAPFEYTMASRYLDKAWEEIGTGQYKMSVTLAQKSAEWSDCSIVQVETGRRSIDVDLNQVEDAAPEGSATAPADGTPDAPLAVPSKEPPAPSEPPAPPAPAPAAPSPPVTPPPSPVTQPVVQTPQPGPTPPQPGPTAPEATP